MILVSRKTVMSSRDKEHKITNLYQTSKGNKNIAQWKGDIKPAGRKKKIDTSTKPRIPVAP